MCVEETFLVRGSHLVAVGRGCRPQTPPLVEVADLRPPLTVEGETPGLLPPPKEGNSFPGKATILSERPHPLQRLTFPTPTILSPTMTTPQPVQENNPSLLAGTDYAEGTHPYTLPHPRRESPRADMVAENPFPAENFSSTNSRPHPNSHHGDGGNIFRLPHASSSSSAPIHDGAHEMGPPR